MAVLSVLALVAERCSTLCQLSRVMDDTSKKAKHLRLKRPATIPFETHVLVLEPVEA